MKNLIYPNQSTPTFSNKLGLNIWQVLTKPSSAVKDIRQIRNARLLSVFTLILLTLFFGFMFFSFINIDNYQLPPADIAGYLLLVFIYITSRTKLYRVGIIIAILLFPMNTFANIFQGTTQNPANTINFLVFSYVFVGIFLSILGTALYSFSIVTIILFLPLLAPETISDLSIIIQPFTINTITALLVLVSMNHRNQVEQERQNELKITYDNTLFGLSQALEFRDKETKGHSQRVTIHTIQLAISLGITGEDKLQHIRRGALLHDIGKIAISNSVLLKKEPLNDEEWEEIYLHPEYAYQMLKDIPFLKPALEIPCNHHEKWDGTGYPSGIKGEEIPFSARIFSVIDVWDALRSDRPYRKAWASEKALNYIKEQKGHYFDPQVVDQFFKMILDESFIKL